jgi:hypothetical protein
MHYCKIIIITSGITKNKKHKKDVCGDDDVCECVCLAFFLKLLYMPGIYSLLYYIKGP